MAVVLSIEMTTSPQPHTLFHRVREIFRHGAVYGFGSVLQTLVGFILIPLYTKHYTTETYGVLALLSLCGTVGGSMFYLGATSALSRSYFDYPTAAERQHAIGSCLSITLVGAALQVALGGVFAATLSRMLFGSTAYAWQVFFALGSSALMFINNLFYIILRFERKSLSVILINLAGLVSGVSIIIVLLVGLRLGVMAPILGDFLNQCLLLGALCWITRGRVWPFLSRVGLRGHLSYGLPVMLAGLAYYVLVWADRLILEHVTNLAEVGVYSLGYRLGSAINVLLVVPFAQIWAPMRMEYRNDAGAAELYKRVLTYYCLIGLIMTACAGVFSPEFLSVIARRPEYQRAAGILPIIMSAQLVYGTVNIIDCGITFSRRTILHTYIFIACIPINIVLNVVLISRYGAIGAAWAALITFTLLATLVYIVSNRLYRFEVEGRRLAVAVATAAAVVGLSHAANFGGLTEIAFKCGLIALMLYVLMFYVLRADERAGFTSLIVRGSRA